MKFCILFFKLIRRNVICSAIKILIKKLMLTTFLIFSFLFISVTLYFLMQLGSWFWAVDFVQLILTTYDLGFLYFSYFFGILSFEFESGKSEINDCILFFEMASFLFITLPLYASSLNLHKFSLVSLPVQISLSNKFTHW